MGLGGTAKKLTKVTDIAEKLYSQVGDLRENVSALREDVETTTERVEHLEAESRRQRALVEAMAEQQGVDVDAVLADVEAELEDEGEAAGADPEATDETTDGEQPAEASAGHDKD